MAIKGIFATVEAVKQGIENLSVEALQRELEAGGDLLLLDIREIQERLDLGTIPGAKHAPRGMLEFWADPASPYHREWFQEHRRTVLFCASGGRSALAVAALKEMGFANVAHLDDGFGGWEQAGLEVEDVSAASRWMRRPKA